MAEKRTLKEKVQGMFPNVGEITNMLDQRFVALIGKLDEMLAEQRTTNELLRQQKG